MLFKPQGRLQRPLSFHQELSTIKKHQSIPQDHQKSHKNYQLTLSVLDLLAEKCPQFIQQLLTIKQSISKWYEHIRQENLAKTRQIFNLREKLVLRIKKEVGMVLEQIAYYLRSITEEYQDKNLEAFYVKYLIALKKLEWGTDISQEGSLKYVSQSVQTLIGEEHFQPAFTPRNYQKTSLETIESPVKKYKDIDLHKYLDTKEENLNLQRQCDKLNRQIDQLQEQKKKLKLEIANCLKNNYILKENQEKYLGEVSKLTEILQNMKKQQEMKNVRQKQADLGWQGTKNKYSTFSDLKDTIYKNLDSAEQQIRRKEKEMNEHKAEEYFNKNYYLYHDEYSDSDKNVPGCSYGSQYRYLIVQALSIEDFLTNPEVQNRNMFLSLPQL